MRNRFIQEGYEGSLVNEKKSFQDKLSYACAVTVAAVGTLASAGVAAYGAYGQSKAAEAAGAGSPEDRYGTKLEPVPFGANLGTEDSLTGSAIPRDVAMQTAQSLPQVFSLSKKINKKNLGRAEKLTGGNFQQTIQQEGANILAMQRGQVPQDVVESINRIVAENLGGAFDPTAQGGGFAMSGTAADTARRLGMTSLDLSTRGTQMGAGWRASADSFLYKPQAAFRDFYLPQAQMAMQGAEQQYISDNNIARAAAMPDPQVTGAANDALVLGSLQSQAMQNMGNAGIGLITGGANLYNSFGSTGAQANSSWQTNARRAPAAYRAGGYA
jgi:hypothetical protein